MTFDSIKVRKPLSQFTTSRAVLGVIVDDHTPIGVDVNASRLLSFGLSLPLVQLAVPSGGNHFIDSSM